MFKNIRVCTVSLHSICLLVLSAHQNRLLMSDSGFSILLSAEILLYSISANVKNIA